MKRIVEIRFGSHLYGTDTPESDFDIKSIYLPLAQDILLQRIQPVIAKTRIKKPGEKNTSADKDFESYSPGKFINLLAEGQTVALDMLFAPESSMLCTPDPLWEDFQKVAVKIFNKQSASFVRYCRQQANKYGIKGSRISAAREALKFLIKAEEQYGSSSILSCVEQEIIILSEKYECLAVGEMLQSDGYLIPYWEICGKKAVMKSSIKAARLMVQKLLDAYGARALSAEKNEGIDWKALSHAVRVGYEAIEFLSSHKITFPRPEAQHLLAIKRGNLSFRVVADEIECLLHKVDVAAQKSTLPDSHDPAVVDMFIEKLYGNIVMKEFASV